MNDALQFTLTDVVARLRRDLAMSPRDPSDLQRNAALWIAVRSGTPPRRSSFALAAPWKPDTSHFSDAGYLATLGFLANAESLGVGDRTETIHALLALMKRSPHTVERSGFADDPLCAAGLVLLAKALGLDGPIDAILRALQDAPTMAPSTALVVVCTGLKWWQPAVAVPEDCAGALAAVILGGRIELSVARHLFPGISPDTAKNLLLQGLCRGSFVLGRDFESMLTLVALETDILIDGLPAPSAILPPHLAPTVKTILFLAANPPSTKQLALDEEAPEIEVKIRASAHRDTMRVKTRWAVRADDLLQALNEDRPTIVHFSGHGAGRAGIALHDGTGVDHLVSTRALKCLFSAMKDDIRVVVLSACYSCEQAREIVDVIDCVVGMKASVRDDVARVFAAAFYRALGFGRTVQNAFDQGLVAVELRGINGSQVAELLVRPGVDASTLVLVPASAPDRKR
jgi:hypothetical protein